MLYKATPDIETTEDPLLEMVPDFFAEEDDAPKRAGDPFEIGLGAFILVDSSRGTYVQSARRLWAAVHTLETLAAWIEENQGPARDPANAPEALEGRSAGYSPYTPLRGSKCAYYSGIPRLYPEGCTAENFRASEVVILDFDGLPIDLRPRLEDYLQSKGGYLLHTSKSHDPTTGRGNYKTIIPCNRTMRPREAQRVSERFCEALGAHLGISVGPGEGHILDTHGCRLQQPETVPYFEREDLEQWFEVRVHDADPLDVSTMLEDVRLELEAEDILEAEIRERIASGDFDISDIDRVGEARKEIERRWLCSPGEGVSNSHVFMGAVVCVGWALTEEEAEGLLLEIYGGAGHDPAYVGAKIRGAYRDPRGLGSRLRRAAAAALDGAELEDLVYAHGSKTRKIRPPVASGIRDSTTLALRDPSSMGGGTPAPAEPPAPAAATAGRYLRPHRREDLESAPITLVRAPTGTGKTTGLAPMVKEIKEEGGKVLASTPRRTLCRDLGAALDLDNYEDLEGDIKGSAVVCLPSLIRVRPWDDLVPSDEPCPLGFEGHPFEMFTLDESEQFPRSLFSSICSDQRVRIWSALKSCYHASRTKVLQDADCGVLTVALLRALEGQAFDPEKVRTLVHKVSPDIKVIVRESKPAWLREYERALEERAEGQGPRLWESCDSATEVRARVAWIREMFPALKVLGIHRENVMELRDLLADKEELATYDVIVCSPTLGTGYNFDTTKIAGSTEFRVFGCFRSFNGPVAHDCKQHLSRVRHPYGRTWTVHVGGASQDATTTHKTADDFYKDVTRITTATEEKITEIGSGWDVRFDHEVGGYTLHPCDDELVRLWAEVQAYEARWSRLAGPEGAFCEHLRTAGYDVHYIPAEDEDTNAKKQGQDIAEEISQTKKDLEEREVLEVLAASEIDEEEALELDRKDLRREDERRLRRYKIQDYTGLDYESVTAAHVRWWDRGRGAKRSTAYADLINVYDNEDQAVLYSDLRSLNGGSRVDCRNRWVKASSLRKILRVFGIEDIREDAANATTLKVPKELPKRLLQAISTIWGYRVGKMSPAQVMATLLRGIGVKTKSRQRKKEGRKWREYVLDLETVAWAEEVTRHHVEQSRRDRRELEDRVDVEDLYPGSPEIDLEEIQALMMMECAA